MRNAILIFSFLFASMATFAHTNKMSGSNSNSTLNCTARITSGGKVIIINSDINCASLSDKLKELLNKSFTLPILMPEPILNTDQLQSPLLH